MLELDLNDFNYIYENIYSLLKFLILIYNQNSIMESIYYYKIWIWNKVEKSCTSYTSEAQLM